MISTGVDYSFSRPPISTIVAKGYSFVMRYLSHTAGKSLTSGEAHSLLSAGLNVGCVWEDSGDAALGGIGRGKADGAAALNQANALGFNGGIYFAVDFGPLVSQQAIIDAYFAGIATVLPVSRIGVYGSYSVCKALLDIGAVTYAWQTSAWSKGLVESRAHIYQNANISSGISGTDYDEGLKDNMGLWNDTIKPDGGIKVRTIKTTNSIDGEIVIGADGRGSIDWEAELGTGIVPISSCLIGHDVTTGQYTDFGDAIPYYATKGSHIQVAYKGVPKGTYGLVVTVGQI